MSKVNQTSVGIIILTYNAANYIVPCIKSVLANSSKNFTIIIVDNASSDDTVEIVRKTFPRLTILTNKKNLGYAAGNNVGIRYFLKRNLDYILLLNPDTIVKPNLIQACSDVLIHHNNIGVVGPMIMYMHDKQKIWFAGGYFNQTFCYTRHLYMNIMANGKWSGRAERRSSPASKTRQGGILANRKKIQKTDFITGACMMIRTSIFKQTGLLPEEYFLYFEDAFFCQRVREHGYYCYLLAKPLVYHAVSSATGFAGENTLSAMKAYYFARNPLLYIHRHVHGLRKLTSYIGQVCIRLPHYSLQCIRQQNGAAFIGYLRGFRDGFIRS